MKEVALSERMRAVAGMVTQGSRVCDVGCDHGFIAIYLVQKGISPLVYAMDIHEGPLLAAKEHVRQFGVADAVVPVLSDGLSGIEKGCADTMICAGVGGRLLQGILEREAEKAHAFRELILQPQSEIQAFRRFLRENGYVFLEEEMILEEGKFYPMMKVRFQKETDKRADRREILPEDMFGPILLQKKHPVLKEYLKKELHAREEILRRLKKQEKKERTGRRIEELEEELALYQKALDTVSDKTEYAD